MGFAAEIKEFLGAAKDSWKLMSDTELKDAQAKYTNAKAAAEQKEMDDPLNQKLKEAKLAHMTASTGQIGRETPLQALQRKALQMQIDAANNPQPYGPAAVAGSAPIIRPAIGAPERDTPSNVQEFKRGGLAQKFAIGGVVEDDDLDDEVTPEVTPAIGGVPRATEFSSQQRRAPGAIPLPQARPPNPVDDALKYGAQQIQQAPAIGSARQRAVRGYAQGAGGAPPDDMIQVYRKIDPKGEMGESERNLYALQAVHQFKMNQGDAEGAAKAAFQMLQTYKTAATRYAAIAAVAMKEGHVDEGMKAAMKAYAQVPDGNNMKLYRGKDGRIGYEIEGPPGEDGKPTKLSGGIATPEEIGAAAMKLATPGGFENHLVQMSSGAKIGGKAMGGGAGKDKEEEGGPGAPKPTDYKELQDQVGTHVDKWAEAYKKDPKYKKEDEPTPQELAHTKNMLYHVRRNNDMTDDEGLRRIQSFITAPEKIAEGGQPAFKTFKDPDTKSRIIQFADGASMKIPESDYSAFRTARIDHFKEEATRAKKTAEEAARPSGLAEAWEGTKKKAGELVDDISSRAGAVAEKYPAATEAIKSAGRDVGRLATQAGGAVAEDFMKGAPIIGEGKGIGGDVYGGVNRAIGGAARDIAGAVGPAAAAAANAPNPVSEAQEWLRKNQEATP